MFKLFKKPVKEEYQVDENVVNEDVVNEATNFWVGQMLSSYTTMHSGIISFKIARENNLSEDQVMIFESVLKDSIRTRLKQQNGSVAIMSLYDEGIHRAALTIGVLSKDYIKDDFTMRIHGNDISVYEPWEKEERKLY